MTTNDIIASNRLAYERIASIYAGTEPSEDDPAMRWKCREIFCERLQGPRALEIGCGPAVDSEHLHRRGLNVTATDNCQAFLDIAKQFFPHLDIQEMDMTEPHLDAGSFDGIYAFASFIHLPRTSAAQTLSKLRLLLKPTGILFMALIKSDKVSEYTIEDWGGIEQNPVSFTCYSEGEIERLLLIAGFRNTEFHYVHSKVYSEMPRLVQRGIDGYQVVAYC